MILAFRRPCARHRATLLDWVDRRERGAETDAALGHLDRCRSCGQELADVALALVALRRVAAELADVEPSQDAWLRLRARVTRPGADPWRWRATLGGMATSALLVAVLVAPTTVSGPGAVPAGIGHRAELFDLRRENAYLASIRTGELPAIVAAPVAGSVPRVLPTEIAEVRKEVTSAKPSGQPPEPI